MVAYVYQLCFMCFIGLYRILNDSCTLSKIFCTIHGTDKKRGGLMQRELTFREWLTLEGDAKAATTLGVKPRLVKGWRLGHHRVSPQAAANIVEKTEGKISYADIYGQG
jgi:hypothetical protein